MKCALIVLDGFGIGKDSAFNAIGNARMPFYRSLLKNYPHSQLLTHGEAVGLPAGIMGNSEVGHMTMGAGRVIFQDLVRINRAIADRSFQKNTVLLKTLRPGKSNARTHIMGLLSDGGVHSHLDHWMATLDLCAELGLRDIVLHPFLDGRDTPPDSGVRFLQQLLNHPFVAAKHATIATLMGRYFAMDRDQRWERVDRALEAICGRGPNSNKSPTETIEASYAAGKSDEFVEPVVLDATKGLRDGDQVFFVNYRADRARQITQRLTRDEKVKLAAFAGMTLYSKELANPAVFEPQSMERIFPSLLESAKMTQFRIAETEKYAHVTFFFNGGREEPFEGESRLLVPSPKDVATYDLKPEMSAREVAAGAATQLETHGPDFLLMNFANADMVGHTGNFAATVQAMEALDPCLEKVIGTAERLGYHVLLTADHGNAECMQDDEGRPHTQHTLNPVPAVWIAPQSAIAPKAARKALRDGTLADIMPTLCTWMGLPIPHEVTGKSLC